MKKILVITDNAVLYRRFSDLLANEFPELRHNFDFRRSASGSGDRNCANEIAALQPIDVATDVQLIENQYFMVISLHCKQIFPLQLTQSVRCVNVHPGYNPNNRGWYPQVFAILNGNIVGATIHEMDEFIDKGKIIARQQVPIFSNDTSKEVYERIVDTEMELLKGHLPDIIAGNYTTIAPENDGSYHSKNEFQQLCKIDLTKQVTFKEAIDYLRAMSHGDFYNAYFYDENNRKIYIKVQLHCLNDE